MAKEEKRKSNGRLTFNEPLGQLGESTWALLREAIKEGNKELALGLADYARKECQPVHDVMVDVWYFFIDWIARRCGEEELPGAYRQAKETLDRTLLSRYANLSLESLLQWYARPMRGHFGGPREEGDFKVYEEKERYVMQFDPCGSGGRLMRGGLDGSPPRTGPPFNFGKTSKPYPWSWGKAGIPYYCIHCCVFHEIMAIEKRGYHVRITECPADDPRRPCTWYFYKDPNLIPAVYFERVGFIKDPLKFRPV